MEARGFDNPDAATTTTNATKELLNKGIVNINLNIPRSPQPSQYMHARN